MAAEPLAESGVPGAEAGSWIALLGPKGLPADLVARSARDVEAVMTTPETKQALMAQGATAIGAGPDTPKKTWACDESAMAT